jgi:putative DNA primase/helicase
MIALDVLPVDIRDSARAVLWNREVRNGKPTKVPYQARRPALTAAVDNPETWAPFVDAFAAYEDGKSDGAGIVLGEGIVGVDLDGCRDPVTGTITEDAQRIITTLNSYTEISPSGTGIHILLRGTLPPGGRRKGKIEMYSEGRYFTVTSHHVDGTPQTLEPRGVELAAVHAELWGRNGNDEHRPAVRPVTAVSTDDDALLERARSARNGSTFTALWAGDTSQYGGDDSAADLGLCNRLAFWTGADAGRIDRLFRQSGLMRPKWDSRRGDQTYGDLTIEKAIAGCRETYSGPRVTITKAPDPEPHDAPAGLDPAFLADAVDIIREGQQIAAEGVRYTVEGIVPNYGMLGMHVAFAKVGKTTLGQALGADVAMGRPFLDHATLRCRVLDIAAEDPPEYTAYIGRTLKVDRGWMTFYRAPIRLDIAGLDAICATITEGGYGLVLISSWQSVVRGLIEDENDNAGAVCVVEHVKAAARQSGVPWLIDAHSGKGEDQSDDADPTKALRGASAAAGAADYMLSLRYSNGAFGTQRRLSGKGRFVSFAPLVMDFDLTTGIYTVAGSAKAVTRETTWRLICETGALVDEPRSTTDIARCIGMVLDGTRLTGGQRQQIRDALRDRSDVGIVQGIVRGQKTTRYTLLGLS